jgi:hypothetical protein
MKKTEKKSRKKKLKGKKHKKLENLEEKKLETFFFKNQLKSLETLLCFCNKSCCSKLTSMLHYDFA